MTPENPAVARAFERSEGLLYADGWGERTPGILRAPGHWLCKEEGHLITDRGSWRMLYRKASPGTMRLKIAGEAGETELTLEAEEGEIPVRLPVTEGKLTMARVIREPEGRVFIALISGEDESMNQGEPKEDMTHE